ncbi:phage tail protein [Burkholderia sp. FERM BP-3421]|uniref:phage tail protein n=1 Tax=Burkholderia sp. FERM BP-3421 TaxID=1494466 RepID=UPI00236108E2|nr:phage tail protein [Burkholderia sp. FERM BP-3421]WDD95935.1 phage tail protein [Burkholderia sp. FERM BP-3421]
MIKPDSLRRALVAAGASPDKLTVSIEQGALVATGAPSPSFEYRYVLNVTLRDAPGDPDPFAIALVAWLAEHEPALPLRTDERETGVTFDMTPDNGAPRLMLRVKLSEPVVVTTLPDGGRRGEHLSEPAPAWSIAGLYAPPGTILG